MDPALLIALILILLSMIFSASESAFLSVNKLRIRFLRNKKHKGALRAGSLLDNKERLLNTVLVGNNIVNIAITAILTSFSLDLFGPSGVGIATVISTIVLLIFGEITPKTLGSKHPEPIVFTLSPVLFFFSILLKPLVVIFTFISRLLARMFGIRFNETKVSFTEDEIKTLIEVGEEEGILESGEKRMMHRVFKFTDLAAKDIMVPRTEIIFVSLSATYSDIIELSQKSHKSRFPVKGKDIDDIQGILYVKDVLLYMEENQDFSVKKVMRSPLYILETKKMSSVQQLLREKNQTIAIVLDEYSGTSGLLTIEDISQEIFGTMSDEYDGPSVPHSVKITDTEALINGDVRLLDLSESLGIKLESPFYETIGGFIMEKLDNIPSTGDSITVQGWIFTVNLTSRRRIRQVHIKQISAEEVAE
jgi:CBS domain containing-hemolysin-like protein